MRNGLHNSVIPVFKEPELGDYKIAEEILRNSGIISCDYNYATIYLWRDFFHQKICFWNDMILSKVTGRLGEAFLCPAGTGDLKETVEALQAYCDYKNIRLLMVCVTEEQKAMLDLAFPGMFTYEEDRDAWDYVYSVQKLAELPGRKLHGKRNHINSFILHHPDWTFEILDKNETWRCRELLDSWAAEKRSEGFSDDDLRREALRAYRALSLAGELDLVCGAVFTEGRVAAFSVGSRTNPFCFNIHVEKASDSITGSYQIINREIARYVQRTYPEVTWINREDDMGLKGLRESKGSYQPDRMIKKYIVSGV